MLDVDERRKHTDLQMTSMATATLPVWSQSNGKTERRVHTREMGKMHCNCLPFSKVGQWFLYVRAGVIRTSTLQITCVWQGKKKIQE